MEYLRTALEETLISEISSRTDISSDWWIVSDVIFAPFLLTAELSSERKPAGKNIVTFLGSFVGNFTYLALKKSEGYVR